MVKITLARDSFVYVYGIKRILGRTSVWLARVPKDHIKIRSYYEFFTGTNERNEALWHIEVNKYHPVFKDPNGVGKTVVIYNAGINRYILTTTHGPWSDGMRRLGVFDAPEPWGPWTTVQYNENLELIPVIHLVTIYLLKLLTGSLLMVKLCI